MKLVSSAAYAASQAMCRRGVNISRSHLSEVVAALLGYRTLAALYVEESDQNLDYHLDDAERLILNIPLGLVRASSIGLSEIAVHSCVEALKVVATVPVHSGISDLYDGYAREMLELAIAEGDSTAMATAESNASFEEGPYMEDEATTSGDLWEAPTEWSIEATGTMSGEYDPDSDRMYNGHSMDVWGKLLFFKAGRAGLIYIECEDGASPDDTWRDEEI